MSPATSDLNGAALYEQHAPELLRRLRRGFGYRVKGGERRYLVVHSAFEREEIVQETFCRFLEQRAKKTFDEARDPAPYIFRIGYNTALRYTGRLSRELPDEHVTVDGDKNAPAIEDASQKLEREEIGAQVRAVLTTLQEKDREVFRLSYDAGLSQAKVAERLDLSRDQVFRRLVALRGAVYEHLKGLGWLDDA